MISVDPRIGSGHYVSMLSALSIPVQKKHMKYGDLAFSGYGPTAPVAVGIEVKKVGDLISSLVTKRLTAHQLPGMQRTYDVIYLAVVGRHRAGEAGAIETAKFGHWSEHPTRLSWGQLQGMLSSIRHCVRSESGQGVIVIPFDQDKHFIDWLVHEYAWWQREFASHSSHVGLRVEKRLQDDSTWIPTAPTLTTQVASLLSGIGDQTAREVGKKFGSVVDLVNASVKEWGTIDGVGKKRAAQAWLSLRGE